jgi:GAF domain-containing protein
MSSAAQTGEPSLREIRRLDAIRRWRVLDTAPECFEQIAAVAARIFDVPFAVVTVVDSEHIWFKAHHGLDIDSIPRNPGLCSSVVETSEPLILPDARLDPAALPNPLVAGEFGLRFYAAAPLTTSDGYDIGTLAVFDQCTRDVTTDEQAILTDLAGVVVREFEVRYAARVEVLAEQQETELERAKVANLDAALGTHGTIGQAMGIIMAQRGHPSEVAFDALRQVSQKCNTKVAEVARRLVEDFDARARTRTRA